MAQIFNQAFEQKLIYVYRINDTAHEGILKIGEASCNAGMAYFAFAPNCKELNDAAKERIRHQTQTEAIEKTIKRFKKSGGSHQMLMRTPALRPVLPPRRSASTRAGLPLCSGRLLCETEAVLPK